MVTEDSGGCSYSRNSKMLSTQGFWSEKLFSELHSQICHIPVLLKQDNFTGKDIADKKKYIKQRLMPDA